MRSKPTSLLVLLALLLALAGCGGDDAGGSRTASSGAGGAEQGAFPVTLEHKYGSTTIEQEPKRVVVAGLREQDALLALGVVPVAVTKWLDQTINPWAKAALGSAKAPVVLSFQDGIETEKIAAQRPDLILAVYSGMTKKEYTTLSKLAPVVAQPKGEVDYGSSWQEETLISGKAVGREQQAQELVDENEAKLAQVKADHPEFQGQTGAVVSQYQGVYVYGPSDVRSRFLEEIGFEYPKPLVNAFPEEFGGQLSQEKVDELDLGTLVWFTETPGSESKIKKLPVYEDLAVRKEGRDVFVGAKDRVYDATSFVSVLSIDTLIKEYVPRLAAAADGNPSTSTDETT